MKMQACLLAERQKESDEEKSPAVLPKSGIQTGAYHKTGRKIRNGQASRMTGQERIQYAATVQRRDREKVEQTQKQTCTSHRIAARRIGGQRQQKSGQRPGEGNADIAYC